MVVALRSVNRKGQAISCDLREFRKIRNDRNAPGREETCSRAGCDQLRIANVSTVHVISRFGRINFCPILKKCEQSLPEDILFFSFNKKYQNATQMRFARFQDEMEQQIRNEHYSSSNPGGGTGGGANLNLKLNSSVGSRAAPPPLSSTNYYNMVNTKHLLGERQPPNNHTPSNLNIMSNMNLINSAYNVNMMDTMYNMDTLDNHYNLNVNNYLNQQMNSLNVGNGVGGASHLMNNHIGPPPSHYATMPLPTHHRDARPRMAPTDHLNNSIINPLAMVSFVY